jgi:hypothetical protein
MVFGRSANSGPVVWSAPPKALDLGENEVHVWRASLKRAPELIREKIVRPAFISRAIESFSWRPAGFFGSWRGRI